MNKPIDTRQDVQPVLDYRHGLGDYQGQPVVVFEINNSGLIYGMVPAQAIEFAKNLMNVAAVAQATLGRKTH